MNMRVEPTVVFHERAGIDNASGTDPSPWLNNTSGQQLRVLCAVSPTREEASWMTDAAEPMAHGFHSFLHSAPEAAIGSPDAVDERIVGKRAMCQHLVTAQDRQAKNQNAV